PRRNPVRQSPWRITRPLSGLRVHPTSAPARTDSTRPRNPEFGPWPGETNAVDPDSRQPSRASGRACSLTSTLARGILESVPLNYQKDRENARGCFLSRNYADGSAPHLDPLPAPSGERRARVHLSRLFVR